jgi:membrane protease subunit (stomatin/prohibitin family)
MGLLDRLRHELIDIVEWLDHTRDTLVWRFPRYRNEIKNGAQLIVRPGQTAIFVHRGNIADTFEPGNYRLTADNLPILSTLMGWKYGFESPFKSEIYFVNTRQITELKWGTPNPIMLRDPEFGPIRLRAFGVYALKAAGPKALLKELVGTDEVFEADEILELMRGIINTSFADMLGKSEIAALDLASNYQAMSESLRAAVSECVDDEYGLDIPILNIVNISLPEEVEQALDTRTSMGVIGDMTRFQQYQMGQAMTSAAENPAGGGASAGMGLGMGFAMANQMMQNMPQAQAGGPAGPPPAPAAGPVFHVAENGQSLGPFNVVQLQQNIVQGRITPDTMVWTAGMTSWQPAGQVPPLAGLFGPPPLPAP